MSLFAKIALAFEHGGFWMYPILALQLFSIAVIIERTYVLFFKYKPNQKDIAAPFEDSIRRGEMTQLISKTEAMQATSPIARVTLAGAKAAQNMGGKEEIQGKMDEVLGEENSLLDRRVAFLSMFGNVATLTGLLGTISGMIKSFAAVAGANPSDKAALLAAGISTAMNATLMGLGVAIPCMLFYSVFAAKTNRLIAQIEQSGVRTLDLIKQKYYGVSNQTAKQNNNNNFRRIA